MVGTQISKELVEDTFKAIETARSTGKLRKGSNEATKALERGTAKLVAIANDVEPKEVVLHLPVLAQEKGIICVEVGTKEELGAAAGIQVGTTCVAIEKEGEAKKIINRIVEQVGKPAAEEEKKEEKKEEKPAEKPVEKKEKKEAPKKEAPKKEEKKEAPKEEKKEAPKEEKKEEKKEEAPKEEKPAEKPEEKA
ncbi:ribosomal L7Ae/L30e/S12e/Gadd45 family protein [Candidatus Woesearchaeota archaeon]|nr:ribosomal L7Ae/L30e/S12e/Gadd45 family protein [Candidatus Woesearchaeota archaeon]